MKKYFCKSLALGMTVLNLCSPVLATDKDIQQENITNNNENNLKSCFIKGAKITGGVVIGGLGIWGLVSIFQNIGAKLKRNNLKKEEINKFLTENPEFDEDVYDSIYKVFYSSCVSEKDVQNFIHYIYRISSRFSNPKNQDYTKSIISSSRFPDNDICINKYLENCDYKNSSNELIKLYCCTRFIYERYFASFGRDDYKCVRVNRAFYIFLNSDFYKSQKYESELSEKTKMKYKYCILVSNLSNNEIDVDPIINNINGNYLGEFYKKLAEAENDNDVDKIAGLSKIFENNFQIIKFQKYLCEDEDTKIKLNIVSKASNENILVLRTGAYEITIDEEIKLLERCLNSVDSAIGKNQQHKNIASLHCLKGRIEDMIKELKEIKG